MNMLRRSITRQLVALALTCHAKTLATAGLALGIAAFALGAQAATPSPKAVYNNTDKTLTFYYDDVNHATTGINQYDFTADTESANYESDIPWSIAAAGVATNVVFDQTFSAYAPKGTAYWFSKFDALREVKGIENLNTSSVTNMCYMFKGCRNLLVLDLSGFDTKKVVSMASMFRNCQSLRTIVASESFTTSAVTDSSDNGPFNKAGTEKGCSLLVGGQGTMWGSKNTTIDYARIDGGTAAPGYFTAAPVPVKYVDAAGQTQTANAIIVEGSETRMTWNMGWYAVTNEVTLSKGADCSGDVHLILADTGKLTINNVVRNKSGIGVTNVNSLVIYCQTAGTGELTVSGGESSAGIGGGLNGEGSDITIYGGVVTATGGKNGSGIGGGSTGPGSNIVIHGGTVKATGSSGGAGIGGGSQAAGELITIYGGVVTAKGGGTGAGIGGGLNGSGSDINILGGTVKAYGATSAAGIGGGSNGQGLKITINATVTAKSGSSGAAAIGSGASGNAASQIYVEDGLIVKAGDKENPTEEIEHTGDQDIAIDLAGKMYATVELPKSVTVIVPEVEGATAELFAFDVNGGWKTVAPDKVPTNATVRVLWTADEGKGLTGEGAANVYEWKAEMVADKSEQTAPAPKVAAAGASEVTLALDTEKYTFRYFDAADILPIWYSKDWSLKVRDESGEETELVKEAANTNTLAWAPTELGHYYVTKLGGTMNIYLMPPVEVTTNDLEVTGAAAAVTVIGAPLEAQTEGEFAGKLIVPSNETVKVTWTVTEKGKYFADGSTTYVQDFTAEKSVNPASAAVELPEAPQAPSMKLGVVAQRYPWDGTLDIQYRARNVPKTSCQIKVTVTLADGTSASETHEVLRGENKTTFDAKKAFGEVHPVAGAKVTAELVESEE